MKLKKLKRDIKGEKKIPEDFYSYFSKGNLFIIQERGRKVLELLNKYQMRHLAEKKVLDIGCGIGGWLRDFIQWGAKPENLYGIDLLEDKIKEAKQLNPNVNFICGSAEKLNFPDESFDIVLQSTCFTSIFDSEMKKRIAGEMLRVVRDHGIILWYDFRYNNPKNSDVKGIKKKEIKELFPNCRYDFNLITLAPPIVRKLAPISLFLCEILEKIPFLKTHYLVIIRKK
jgi:ubiquinone/menaquinone biosynthesis C-methylase UbiE